VSRSLPLRQGRTRVVVRLEKEGAWIGDRRLAFQPVWRDGRLVGIERDARLTPVRVARDGGRAFVWCGGRTWEIERGFTAARPAPGERAGDLLAPMPGRVRRTLVQPGDTVTRGQVLMILEAMKMEHAIRAPRDGVVARLRHGEGDLVEAGVPLAEIT